MQESPPVYINDATVRKHLSWSIVVEATKEALSAVSNGDNDTNNFPIANQPPRSFTWTARKEGVLLSMPGFAGRYTVDGKKYDSLGCKLVTAFVKNRDLPNPMASILANILLMDSNTGQLKCIMEATEITAWRTASASVNATKFLYFNRQGCRNDQVVLAIIGCGVEGRSHAIGLCSTFPIQEVRLWNRTKAKAESLSNELENMKITFQNPNVKISVVESSDECALVADIICTATFSDQPVLLYRSLKTDCHINAIGAGVNHYSELERDIYMKSQLYVDSKSSAENELKGLDVEIVGEVGEVINGSKSSPKIGITVFQSMGMACEDVMVAQCIYNAVKGDFIRKVTDV